MASVEVLLPNGNREPLPAGQSLVELAKRSCPQAVAARFNGELVDLSREPGEPGEVELITFDDPAGAEVYRHTTSHVMAQAVKELFPQARLAIGPALEDRFYYDFDVPQAFTDEDLARIEERMREIIARDLPVVREEMSREQAIALFSSMGETYKVEILEMLPDERVSCYRQGDFVDLCRGPHLPATGGIGVFKLLSVAGAYWRGDERNPMLQRIYGTSFPTQERLDEFLRILEEAEKRDHRKVAKEMELFSFFEEAGPGMPYYHPKGALLKHIVEEFLVQEHLKRGYQLLWTPHLVKSEVWEISGHKEQAYPMFFTRIEDQEYGVKPMNCPGHIMIYRSKLHSYRELPIRFFELGTVYRGERSGVLHGLMRVRGFTQDDAHIFCRPDQLRDEVVGVVRFAHEMLGTFGFHKYDVYLSTRPPHSIGSDENWERSTGVLEEALEELGAPYQVDRGGGAFYGPKVDVKIRDAIGRAWQGPTIQLDLNLPERFDLEYVDQSGQRQRPAMVHRVVLAGIERFLGVLIEHYGGLFPLWLAPVQAVVVPVSQRVGDYAEQVHQALTGAGMRATLNDQNQTVAQKIKLAELEKIPCILVVGEREKAEGSVTLRRRGREQEVLPLSRVVTELSEEATQRRPLP